MRCVAAITWQHVGVSLTSVKGMDLSTPTPPLFKVFSQYHDTYGEILPPVPASLVFQSIPSTPSAYSPHPSPPPPPPYSPSHINKAVVSSARWQMDSVRKPLHHTHQLFVYAKLSWCPWIEYLESLTSSITFAPSAGCVRYIYISWKLCARSSATSPALVLFSHMTDIYYLTPQGLRLKMLHVGIEQRFVFFAHVCIDLFDLM